MSYLSSLMARERRYAILWEASLEFWMIYPPGALVRLKDKRFGGFLDARSCGTYKSWFTHGDSAQMPRVALPDGTLISLDVTAEAPRYELAEPLPFMSGMSESEIMVELFIRFLERRTKRKHSTGARMYASIRRILKRAAQGARRRNRHVFDGKGGFGLRAFPIKHKRRAKRDAL